MVLEAIPKTAAARPPTFGGPPIGTTFSNDPDDRDDMLVHLRDNVERLVRQAERSDRSSLSTYLKLLDQRREWIRGELNMEGMFSELPRPPLGIPEDAYDLRALSTAPVDPRRREYERLLNLLERTQGKLWDRLMNAEEA